MATTRAALAAELGVSEGDVDVLLQRLHGEDHGTTRDGSDGKLPDEVAGSLRQVLDPCGARTMTPELYCLLGAGGVRVDSPVPRLLVNGLTALPVALDGLR